MNLKPFLLTIAVLSLVSCKKETNYIYKIEGQQITISDSLITNTVIDDYIKPYREHVTKDLDSVLKSKPYTEGGISYFKFKDFWAYVIKQKTWSEKKYPKNKTIRLLEQLFGAKTDVVKITMGKDEKSVKVWTVEKIEVEKYIPRRIEKQPAAFE